MAPDTAATKKDPPEATPPEGGEAEGAQTPETRQASVASAVASAVPVDPRAAEKALAAFLEEEGVSVTHASDKAPEAPEASTSPAPQRRSIKERREKRQADRVPVVIFDHVTKTYNVGDDDEYTAIKDVSFAIEDIPDKGEFVSILGPSGCGKSTVLRLIAGLEPQHPPTHGNVIVYGDRIAGPGADRGMVFQSYTSFDHRTVLQNIAFGLECQGGWSRSERRDLSELWIHKVGLSVKHDADKYPHELSGGMQQRVAIARTLILKPKIILMDEPFGALDPLTRMHMQDTLVTLWNEVESTVFLVTHSIEEAVYLGDRVYIFSNPPGKILKEVDVPPPDRPAMKMQRERSFQDLVFDIRDLIDRLENEDARKASS